MRLRTVWWLVGAMVAAVVVLGAAFLVSAAPLILYAVVMATWSEDKEAPQLARMPSGLTQADLVLAVERRSLHPFRREYRRALLLLRGDAEASRFGLPYDLGSLARVSVYATEDGALLVEDRNATAGMMGHSWAVDLAAAQVRPTLGSGGQGRLLGWFDELPGNGYGWFPGQPARDPP